GFPAFLGPANGWKSVKMLPDRQGRGQWGNGNSPCEPVNLSQHEPSPAAASFASRCRHRFGTPAQAVMATAGLDIGRCHDDMWVDAEIPGNAVTDAPKTPQ